MKGLFKLLAVLIGIVIVAIVAAILIIPQVFDPNEYKGQITELVRDKTGRDLTIDGDLKLSVFPGIEVKTGRLALANPAGFGDFPMLEVDGINVDVSLLPLLSKKVEAGEVKLVNPVIRLITLEDGTTNWQDLAASDEGTQAEASNSTGGDSALAALAIQGITIENGAVLWDDRKSPVRYDISELALQTGPIIPGRAIPIELGAHIESDSLPEPLDVAGALNATADLSLSDIGLNTIDVTVTGPTINTAVQAPDARIDLENQRISVTEITGSASVGENSVSLNLPDLDVDLAGGVLAAGGLAATAKAGDATANVAAQSLGFDLASSVVTLGAISGDAVSGDMSARLSVPQLRAGVADKQFKFQNIGIDAKIRDLAARVNIPDITVDTESMAIAARGVTVLAEGLELNADINARNLNATPEFDGQAVLAGADLRAAALKAGGFAATDPNALSSVDLSATFSGTPGAITVSNLDGRIDDTPVKGSATIDLDNNAYAVKLSGGTLVVDRYLPKSDANTSPAATPAAAAGATAAAPATLGALNVDADVRMQKLVLESSGIAIENLELLSSARSGSTTIPASLKGTVSGDALPEPVVLDSSVTVDISDPAAMRFNDVIVAAKGATLSARLGAPVVDLPGDGPIRLADLSAAFDYQNMGVDLNVPQLELSPDQNALTVAGITGSGRYDGYRSDLRIEKLTGNISRNAFAINGLKAKVAGESNLGDITAGALKVDLTTETLNTENLSFTGEAGTVDMVVNGTDILKAPKISGNVKSEGLNVRALLALAGIDYEPSSATALGAVDIDTAIEGGLDSIKLAPFSISLDGTPITGFVDITQKPAARYAFNVNVGDLNLDDYLPKGSEAEQNAASGEGNAAAAVAVPAAMLKNLDVNGQIKISKLTTAGMEVSDIEVGAKSDNGIVTMAPILAKLYGGEAKGKITVDARNEAVPVLTVSQSLLGVQIGPALAAGGVSSKLEGTGNLVANLTATGIDDRAIRESMDGTVNFDLRDGAIKGFDLRKILVSTRKLYEQAKGREPSVDSAQTDETRFSEMTGSLVMRGGSATNDDLSIKAPLFRVGGAGKASLVEQTVDYTLTVNVVDSFDGQGGAELASLKNVPVPVRVRGPFESPKFSVDFGTLLKGTAKKKAKEKLQEKLQEKLGIPTGTTGQGTSDTGTAEPKSTRDILQQALQRKLDKKYGNETGQPETTQRQSAPAPSQQEQVQQQRTQPEPPPEDPKEALKQELKKKLLKGLFN